MEEFIRCYEEIYPRMYKTAYYYLKNAEEAKDAVQDAALISYEKWGQLREKEKNAAWMMQILVNRCKRRMRTWFRKEDDIEDILSNRSEETSKETDFAMQAAVKEVFWELKDEERLIVALSVFGGYTGEEIAGILEKNPSTIRSKYRRALKKMREKLEG